MHNFTPFGTVSFKSSTIKLKDTNRKLDIKANTDIFKSKHCQLYADSSVIHDRGRMGSEHRFTVVFHYCNVPVRITVALGEGGYLDPIQSSVGLLQ